MCTIIICISVIHLLALGSSASRADNAYDMLYIRLYLHLSETPQEAQGTHSIPNQLTQPLALFRLRVSQFNQLTRQFRVGNEYIPMNSQKDTHDRLDSFEITMRAESTNKACEE